MRIFVVGVVDAGMVFEDVAAAVVVVVVIAAAASCAVVSCFDLSESPFAIAVIEVAAVALCVFQNRSVDGLSCKDRLDSVGFGAIVQSFQEAAVAKDLCSELRVEQGAVLDPPRSIYSKVVTYAV